MRPFLVLVLTLLAPSALAQAEVINLRTAGGTESALRAALDAGKSVDLAGLTVPLAAGLVIPANQTLFNGAIDASAVSGGAAITITNGPNSGGMPFWRALDRLTIRVHEDPRDGQHSTTTDGVLFSGFNIGISNVTVQGARRAFTFNSNTWAIQINDSAAWFNEEGLTCARPQGGGAAIRLNHVEFAHNDYAIFNHMCEITISDSSFDSAIKGFVRDNITSVVGTNGSVLVFNDCRFESGGSPNLPWIKNSGYMLLRQPIFYEAVSSCSQLFDNSGDLEISGGFSRLRSQGPDGARMCAYNQWYSSRNTAGGRMTVRGLRPVDGGVPLRFTPETSRVRNGDIESGTIGFAATGGAITLNTADPHAGTKSLQYRSSTANTRLYSSAIPVTPGAGAYHFSLYYKNENLSELWPVFEFFSANGTSLGTTQARFENPGEGRAAWDFARWSGAVPVGAAFARFSVVVNHATSGGISIDDLYYSDW